MDAAVSNVPLSKYARKVRERAEGTRPPFEFVERTPLVSQSGTAEDSGTVQSREQVAATVCGWGPGCLFLRQQSGPDLFLGMYVLKKSKLTGVKVSTVLLCEVEPHPNGKGPRVAKILSRIEN